MEEKNKEFIRGIIRDAFPELFAPTSFSEIDNHPEEHPVSDIDFLVALETGSLTQEEQNRFLKHLTVCPSCRNEVVAMIRSGILFEDSLNIEKSPQSESHSPAVSRSKSAVFKRNPFSMPASLISAAVILIAVIGVGGFLSVPQITGYRNYQNGLTVMNRFQPSMNENGESFPRRITISSDTIPANNEIAEKPASEYTGEKTAAKDSLFAAEEKVLAKAAASHNDDPALQIFYAQFLFYKCGKKNEAVEHLQQAAERLPAQTDILFSLACALYQTGNYEKAEMIYGKILEKTPLDLDAVLSKALCLSKQDSHEAAEFLEEEKERFSGNDLKKIETQIREYQQQEAVESLYDDSWDE